jgi:hypothetical protein
MTPLIAVVVVLIVVTFVLCAFRDLANAAAMASIVLLIVTVAAWHYNTEYPGALKPESKAVPVEELKVSPQPDGCTLYELHRRWERTVRWVKCDNARTTTQYRSGKRSVSITTESQ